MPSCRISIPIASAWALMTSDRVAWNRTRSVAGSKKFTSRATSSPRARARISASALSLPPDHMSAYRSADPELEGDDAVADLLHAEAFEAAARRALARAEMRASAVEAEHEPVTDGADRVVLRVDDVLHPGVTHGRRSPRPPATAPTNSHAPRRPPDVARP